MEYNINNDYELIYLIKEDDEQALNSMFKKYEPLIKKIANHYIKIFKDFNIDFEDLVQEGRIGLYRAIKLYNSERNILFYTFAFVCIKSQILTSYKKSLRDKRKSLTLASLYDDFSYVKENETANLTYDLIEENDLIKKLKQFQNELDIEESCIFELRYNSFNYKEISVLLDINIKLVDNKLVKIRNKLRKFLLEN